MIELVVGDDPAERDRVRDALSAALPRAGRAPYWQEWDREDPCLPGHLRRACGLQLYVDGAYVGRPGDDVDRLTRQIAEGRAGSRPIACVARTFTRIAPALLIAALPKCSMCLAMYLTVFGLAGAARWFAPVVLVATALVAGAVFWSSYRTSRLKPAILWGAGVAAVLAGWPAVGIPAVLFGSVWQAWTTAPGARRRLGLLGAVARRRP